jgi:hypothetical protein
MLTPTYLIRKWIEQEVFKQRLLGLQYPQIAESIVRAARREIQPAVALPDVPFPPDFSVTPQTAKRAWHRIIKAIPTEQVDALRAEDNLMTDQAWLSLQKGMLNGDANSISVAVSLLEHRAKVNGYNAPKQVHPEGDLNLKGKTSSDPEESREFQVEVLRAMTDAERKTIAEIMVRAKVRARDIIASRNAKPARLN